MVFFKCYEWDGRGHMQVQPREGIFWIFWNPRWPPNGIYSKKLTMHISNMVK